MRIVFFADLHLDAPFAWARAETARRRRQALRDTLGRILTLAAEVRAEAILCAGDLFEHDRVSPDTGAFLREALAGAGRLVLIAPGNHDRYERQSLYADARWPDSVRVFREGRLTG
jgi:DNA repair exonuclease SbcCD nuclease subunit